MAQRTPKTIAIASGKGGTGKTLVATSLAATLADAGLRVVLVDCDAEAPNDHLFFELERSSERAVTATSVRVLGAMCTTCGACRDVCAFGAIRMLGLTAVVFDELCHGCGMCEGVCPTGAIREIERAVGTVEAARAVGMHEGLQLITGTLNVGEVKTPDVIRAARSEAALIDADVIISDAPPGVACAAVAAIRGADVVIHVTEPTPFGVHDLELSVRLAEALGATSVAVVNRLGMGPVDIGEWCESRGLPVLATLQFDRAIAQTYALGGIASDESPLVAGELTALATALGLLGGQVGMNVDRGEAER